MRSSGITLAAIEEQWRQRCYAEVPVRFSEEQVREAVAGFHAFLGLPRTEKEKYRGLLDPDDRGSHTGYEHKDRGGGNTDTKEYFHMTSRTLSSFSDIAARSPEAMYFLRSALSVYYRVEETMRELVGLFSVKYPDVVQRFFPATGDGHPRGALRFVQYQGESGDPELARGHIDRSAMTLAIDESAPGLEIGSCPEDLRSIALHRGRALFFPGHRSREVFKGAYAPAYHRVVRVGDKGSSSKRWAVVFFCDIQEPNHMSFEECHPYS